MAMAARERGIKKLLVPAVNAREAAVVAEVTVFGAKGTYKKRVKTPRL